MPDNLGPASDNPVAAEQPLTPPPLPPEGGEADAASEPSADASSRPLALFAESDAEGTAPEDATDDGTDDVEDADSEEALEAASAEGEEPEQKPSNKKWYVVKVQSGREESIKEAIERRVKKEGLEDCYGQIVIPVEKFTEVKVDKNNRRVTRQKVRKLYPGYLMAEVEYNDRVLYLFRETSGVGDFVGATNDRDKPPPPMTEREIQRMMGVKEPAEVAGAKVPPKPRGMDVADKVRVTDGTFLGMEGEVKEILEAVGRVKVELTIFGRPVPVELEYYQVEQA